MCTYVHLTSNVVTKDFRPQFNHCFNVTAEYQFCTTMFTFAQLTSRSNKIRELNKVFSDNCVTLVTGFRCVFVGVLEPVFSDVISDQHYLVAAANPTGLMSIPSSTKFWLTPQVGHFHAGGGLEHVIQHD